ncbi:MAG: class I SAM-dependent methyltransferase [Alphaproteobacteria bacterium]|nr:class I SAM-dependent methyltransferase [Alphaproteobacteria bacterium]
MTETQQVRHASNAEIAGELLDLAGRAALDVGCGEGRFTRILAERAATVTGIDVNQVALDRAAAASPAGAAPITWLNARAEDMPFDDASFDIVVFSNSLHHVAPEKMGTALTEAARVLKPGGQLYVMEPLAEGRYVEATRRVNDERAVRHQAKAAVDAAGAAQFAPVTEVFFCSPRAYSSFEEFEAEQSERSEKRKALLAADRDGIRAAFIAGAREEHGKLVFDRVFRVNLLRKIETSHP